MIRKEEQCDMIDISETMAPHVSKESINYWDEDTVQIF